MKGDNVKSIIKELLDTGKLRSAINVYEMMEGDSETLLLFTHKIFDYSERELLPNFLLPKIHELPFSIRPIVLSSLLNLSEMAGSISNMQKCLHELIQLGLNEVFVCECQNNNLANNYFDILMKCFLYDYAYDFIQKIDDIKKNSFLETYESIISFFKENNLCVDDLKVYIHSICNNISIEFNKPVVIFKLPPNFYDNALGGTSDFYPLNLLKELRQSGDYDIVVSPQFSMPGPSISFPYNLSEHILAIIDHHKYSSGKDKIKFIHLKMMHKRSHFLVNLQGYSGWMRNLLEGDIEEEDITSFFLEHQKKWLDNKVVNPYGDFILVPLQIQADSVQKLSELSIVDMLKEILSFFSKETIVITRHPKCRDKELTKYLDNLSGQKFSNVIISQEKTSEILPHCKFVILCNSSVGWDAILALKPIISFGFSEYSSVTHNVRSASDLLSLDFNHIDSYIVKYPEYFYKFWKYNTFSKSEIVKQIIFLIRDENKKKRDDMLGMGLFEDNIVVKSQLRGTNVIGTYTYIDASSELTNAIIGRYCVIKENVKIGKINFFQKSFSNHFFTFSDTDVFSDDFYSSIKTKKEFYERNKVTFIGHDVMIHDQSVIMEGVSVGNGAIILPNSTVVKDVESYEIVGGNPAVHIGYKFNIGDRLKLEKSQWWLYDFSDILSKQKTRAKTENYDYRDSELINKLFLLDKNKKLNVLCSYGSPCEQGLKKTWPKKLIVGPSHVYIWQQLYLEGKSEIPKDAFIFPTNAASATSENIMKLLEWGALNFEEVIYFVPDFRIGNAGLKYLDGKFISPYELNEQNDLIGYNMAISFLDQLAQYKNIKMLFWCLYGREFFNRKNLQYVDDSGNYNHPVWNYKNIRERYVENILDIDESIFNFDSDVHQKTIHPNLKCYDKLKIIIDSIV